MNFTIISNNCSGAALYHDIDMRFNSPTILLQILPQQYPKFCKNLEEYISYDIQEYTDFTEEHADWMFHHLYGCKPYFPVGLCGDIVIMFQHYKTFHEAKSKWDERKKRIDYDHIGYFFVLEKEYRDEAIEFGNLRLPNSVLFTRDFSVDVPIEHYMYHVPDGCEYLGRSPQTGNRFYESNFNRQDYFKRILK